MTEQQAQYLLICMFIIAGAFLIAAAVLVITTVALAKVMKEVMAMSTDAKGKVYPLLDRFERIAAKTESIAASAEVIIADAQPKIQRATANFADTSDVYRAKVAEVDSFLTDTTLKARQQTDRVDDMISVALTRTGEMASQVHHAIMAPARQLSGIVSGARTSIESLVHQFGPKPKAPSPKRVAKPVAFEGESVYTGLEDDYHA